MKQARILALTIGSILFLGLVMYGFKANSSDDNLFGTKLINNNPPNIQLNTEEEIRHLRDIVEELKNILRITLEILEQDDPDYAFMKTEFRKAQYLLKDLKRNNLDSTDIIIYRDKYIDLFTDIVHKAVEAKKKKTSTMPSKEVAKIKELEEKLKDIDDKSGYNIYNSLLGAAEVGNSEQVSILNEIINSMKGQIEGFKNMINDLSNENRSCLLYTSPSPRDTLLSRMPSSA